MRHSTMLTAAAWLLFAGAPAIAQDSPPPDPAACVPDSFESSRKSLEMPVASGGEATACIPFDAARPLERVQCWALQTGEHEHPEYPTPHQCSGFNSQCGAVADFEVLSSGWQKTAAGWSYCATAANHLDGEWRFFQIMAE